MAKEINQKLLDKVVAEIKKNPGQSERYYSDKLNVPQSQIGRLIWMAEPIADPKLKIKQTGPAVRDARDKQGLRWPRIAARTGLSESAVKELYEEATGKSASESYTGRGRNFSGAETMTPSKGRGGSGRRASAKDDAKGASGRRRGTAAGGNKPAGRRGTRASAKAADPS